MKTLSETTNMKCRFSSDTGRGPCVIYITGPFMRDVEELYEKIRLGAGDTDIIFCDMLVEDWDRLLTPWPASDCVQGRCFSGNADALLEEMESKLIPYIRAQYPEVEGIYLAGYSLAGLFSFWTMYETVLFDGVVSCSGSLWYPGWDSYMEGHVLKKDARVYLSLGKNEEFTRHPVMKRVGDATRKQYARLLQDPLAQEAVLEWNPGGHFADTSERIFTGIEWMLQKKNRI